MKQLFLLVPIFKPKIQDEAKYCKQFTRWFITNKHKFLDVGIIPNTPQFIKRGTSKVDREEGYEYVDIQMRGKGDAIRDYLKRLVTEWDNGCNSLRIKYDYVIVIDGDFDINPETVITMASKLVNGKKAVLSCRKGNFGLGKLRNRLERFELCLIEARYSVALPDGQCGCWGFDTSIYLKGMNLTARGFEIELDLIINLLDMEIPIYFIVTEVKQEGESTFKDVEMNTYKKLIFLCNKLKMGCKILTLLYDSFIQEYGKIDKDSDGVDKFYSFIKQFENFDRIAENIPKENKRKLFNCILWEEKTPEQPCCSRCDREEWEGLKKKDS